MFIAHIKLPMVAKYVHKSISQVFGLSHYYMKYNSIGCQIDFRWVGTSYVYKTEEWKRNFIHEFLNVSWIIYILSKKQKVSTFLIKIPENAFQYIRKLTIFVIWRRIFYYYVCSILFVMNHNRT